MAIRRILHLGDPVLRRRSQPVANYRNAAEILVDLRDTLHWFQRNHGFGRGIGAVQIGELKRVVYIEFDGAPLALINPEFTHMTEEKFELWDDCFSFPELMVKVRRSRGVDLRYWDEQGREATLTAAGALSELLQHELDHLEGVLAVDRAVDAQSFATRREWMRQRNEAGR